MEAIPFSGFFCAKKVTAPATKSCAKKSVFLHQKLPRMKFCAKMGHFLHRKRQCVEDCVQMDSYSAARLLLTINTPAKTIRAARIFCQVTESIPIQMPSTVAMTGCT